jgi:hypothetical protein
MRGDDCTRRVRNPTEYVCEFECRQSKSALLTLAFARLPSNKFLYEDEVAEQIEDKRGVRLGQWEGKWAHLHWYRLAGDALAQVGYLRNKFHCFCPIVVATELE